jgi:AbrB family looped-hinge helix DNA binding protein
MAETLDTVILQIGPQGRMVIPASLRRAWKIKAGDIFLARIENDRLVLERPAHIVQRIKGRFAALQNQPSLADELMVERRSAAGQEDAIQQVEDTIEKDAP